MAKTKTFIAGLLMGVLAMPAQADTLCFSPVKKKRGDISSERPWWKPFDYRVQVNDGPVVKPAEDASTPYDFDSERPLVKIWLGNEIVESFYVTEDMLAEGRNCIVFKNIYETWMIVERWQAEKLCNCKSTGLSSDSDGLLVAARSIVGESVGDDTLKSAIEDGIWTEDKTVVAIAVQQAVSTIVLAFVRQPSGNFLPTDISQIEDALFRKLGLANRVDYDRFETTPVSWISIDSNRHLLEVRLQVWRKGQRFTVAGPVIINADGTVAWQ